MSLRSHIIVFLTQVFKLILIFLSVKCCKFKHLRACTHTCTVSQSQFEGFSANMNKGKYLQEPMSQQPKVKTTKLPNARDNIVLVLHLIG